MNNIQLKPCPFCGNPRVTFATYYEMESCRNFDKEDCPCALYDEPENCRLIKAVCDVNAGGCGASTGCHLSEEAAANAWNMRCKG